MSRGLGKRECSNSKSRSLSSEVTSWPNSQGPGLQGHWLRLLKHNLSLLHCHRDMADRSRCNYSEKASYIQ